MGNSALPGQGWAGISDFQTGLNKGGIVRKVQFHEVASCCPVSVTLIYVLFSAKCFRVHSLVPQEGLSEAAVPGLCRMLWPGLGGSCSLVRDLGQIVAVLNPKHSKLCLSGWDHTSRRRAEMQQEQQCFTHP